MEYFRARITAISNVHSKVVREYNGSYQDVLEAAKEAAKVLAARDQGYNLLVETLDCYDFPQVWEKHSVFTAGTDLKIKEVYL